MRPDHLAYQLARVNRLVQARLEQSLQPVALQVEQWRVLLALETENGQSMGDLAVDVLMNHPALTKMIDRMVADGLVHRAPDRRDQRRVLVYLTERGVALREEARHQVGAAADALRDQFGEADLSALERLLARIGAPSPTAPSPAAASRVED